MTDTERAEEGSEQAARASNYGNRATAGGALSIAVAAIVGFTALFLVVVGIFWSNEPEPFDVRENAAKMAAANAQSIVTGSTTTFTLVRVAELGQFEATTLDLKPGRYVAVGIRDGYRDVRQEFLVGFGQTPDAIVVRCEEAVVTRGR